MNLRDLQARLAESEMEASRARAERDAWWKEAMDRADRLAVLERELELERLQSQRRIGELTALVRSYTGQTQGVKPR